MAQIEYDFVDDDEEEEAETMTAAQVLSKLEEAWLNEKFSPDLLESKTELVDCMMEQLAAMEENISRARPRDFRVPIHRMEIERIRFVVASYLRLRLQKIEKFTFHVLEQEKYKEENDLPLLSPAETEYASKYHESVFHHLKTLALDFMPPNLQKKEDTIKQTALHPDLNGYVFLRVNEDTANVLVEEETVDTGEEIINLDKGDQHIMRYAPISALVNSGAVSLI